MRKESLLRMFGGVIWVVLPFVCIMLFLPHQPQVEMDYVASLFLLFCILLIDLAAMMLPFREALHRRYLSFLLGFFYILVVLLTCAAIHFSGGARSPLFPFLLLVNAFCASLIASLSAAVAVSALTSAAYLSTLLVFSRPVADDLQLISAQVAFLLLISLFINRVAGESREQAQQKAWALEELRSLSEMDRATSGFVSAVSFEMRTPLTSILGFSEILASGRCDPEKEREYVEIISREANNLSRLVEDLLDISRLESGKLALNKELAQLDRLMGMSLHLLEPVCDPSLVALGIPPDLPGVLVDSQRMKRVFDAVFGYIVRKSGRDSEVRASAKTEGREVVITFNIRNREAAVRQENGGRIFPPLGAQGEEDLELTMARRIVMAHKGSLSLIQASGGWSAIVLRLPQLAVSNLIASSSTAQGAVEGTPV